MTGPLWAYTGRGPSLPEALRLFGPTRPAVGAVALLYSSQRCAFARLGANGVLTGPAGAPVDVPMASRQAANTKPLSLDISLPSVQDARCRQHADTIPHL